LLYQEAGALDAGSAWSRSRWMHTPLGRVVVGVVLAQGLFYSLRHLFTGIMMMIEGEDVALQPWTSFHGLLFLQALQVLAPMLGGVLAGAGHRGGALIGGLVGAVNGALTLLAAPVQSNTVVALY